ncbi:uncharacterized protein LOC131294489 [Anopheles ziemanni]|uniref:uncharacterized protein LOC131265131 n=1 Tax=Anopheles coustani TaxID=139045 RepID=UPI0026591C8C|nr:uncharacterized protein LOC131265131 [Anopheles coustani]XP_058178519.1 uncharacterized protein LOC131294489 [Anopheles ziemanni]
MADFTKERTFELFQKDFPRWMVNFHDPVELFRRQPSYLASQVYCTVGALVCLAHALHRGGRWPFLWLASTFAGVLIESAVYLSPFGETIWFAPTVIDLFGQRIPSFIFFVYPFFYYQAFWAVSKLQLKCRWSEHIAVGLLVVLFDLPFDMVSVKFLHWTLHDTEQMFAERIYSAPWTLLLFFFGSTFTFSYAFRHLRKLFDGRPAQATVSDPFATRSTILVELAASIGTAIFSVSLGSTLFLAVNYPLHTLLGISNKIVVVGVFLCVATIFWKFDRKSNRRLPFKQSFVDHVLTGCAVGHFWLYLVVAVFLNPQEASSTGRHQPIGDCLNPRTFLCLDSFRKEDFDFHCLPKLPKEGSYWYTICGTPFEHRAEFVFVLIVITFLATMIHRTVHYDYDVRFKVYEFVKKNSSTGTKAKKLK